MSCLKILSTHGINFPEEGPVPRIISGAIIKFRANSDQSSDDVSRTLLRLCTLAIHFRGTEDISRSLAGDKPCNIPCFNDERETIPIAESEVNLLITAICAGDFTLIERLTAEIPRNEASNLFGLPTQVASFFGCVTSLKLLRQSNASIIDGRGDVESYWRLTSSLSCVSPRHTKLIARSDPPIVIATFQGHVNLVRWILSVEDFEILRPRNMRQALKFSVKEGNMELYNILNQTLTKYGELHDVKQLCLLGDTKSGRFEMVQRVIDEGADIIHDNNNMISIPEITPLHVAIQRGRASIAEYIIHAAHERLQQNRIVWRECLRCTVRNNCFRILKLLLTEEFGSKHFGDIPDVINEVEYLSQLDELRYLLEMLFKYCQSSGYACVKQIARRWLGNVVSEKRFYVAQALRAARASAEEEWWADLEPRHHLF